MPVSFTFGGKAYKAKLLTAPGKNDALVFGLGLNPKLDKVWVVFRDPETKEWWSAQGKLTPLAKAAIAAIS
jgi:hypothetical protein